MARAAARLRVQNPLEVGLWGAQFAIGGKNARGVWLLRGKTAQEAERSGSLSGTPEIERRYGLEASESVRRATLIVYVQSIDAEGLAPCKRWRPMMTMTFKTNANRLDALLVCFKSDDHAAMLKEICCNSVTSAVTDRGGYVTVPAHAAEKVAGHLVKSGWSRATA